MIMLSFAASTLFGLATATAAQAPTADKASPVALTPAEQSAPAATVRVKRYCISDRREGAPRRPKICRTREDWQARGFDPLVAIGRL